MIYTPMTRKAMQVAYNAHHGQTEDTGVPYIFHPLHLAEQMDDELNTTAALLHDVVEDTDLTLEDLKNLGFPEEVLEVVSLLTHNPAVPYMDYVAEIAASKNAAARKIKLADLAHNSDLTRLDEVTPADMKRLEKYRKAQALLQETQI